jgi:hypothetical protein
MSQTDKVVLGVSQDKLKEARGTEQAEEAEYDEIRRKLAVSYQKAQRGLQILVGTPKTVIPRIKTMLQVLRPGIFTFFHIQGPVSNADRLTSIRLMAQEVVPAIREYAKELDLPDPYERTPGEVRAYAGARRLPVVNREPLAALGLV